MKTITKTCKNCNQNFDAPIGEHKRGNAKFCSRSCSSKFAASQHRPKPNVVCALCGTEFYKNSSQQKNSKSGLFFCSRFCKDKAQRIGGIKEIQPPHYSDHLYNYRDLAFRSLPNECCRCGYKKQVAALVVHHIDRDRSNNNLSNLEILCANCHAIEHWS